MNLSVLERMVREGDLSLDAMRYLLACQAECEWLDFKEQWAAESEFEISSFVKDAVALKNMGGGYLVVGVKDKTWEPVGLKQRLPYDAKLLRDKIRKATGLELDVFIVHHELPVDGISTIFALIFVKASTKRRKRRTPSLMARDFCPNQKFGFRRGDIFVRKGDSTIRIGSQEELDDLLDSLEELSDRQQLEMHALPSPFAVEDGTYRLLERGYDSFIGRVALRDELMDGSPATTQTGCLPFRALDKLAVT